ncbi:META domain-containing protein [Polyangium jinanense]|uniref:META domain-containing protein n=1 Tax=Polyangium jinanense TaxID=2829994 RepID=A0A9X3WWN7_9BACT|nr:META domain-containing protein [Polyangium jinanense]MDC3953393.1 META domain-containing protein [Polyangium jinanense]MDC3979487.1 META domain-containing protein [Polyangium jinanense]
MGYVLRSLFAMLPVLSMVAPATAEANILANTQWELESLVQGRTVWEPSGRTEVTLEFQADGKATGRAPCNYYFTSYTVEGNTLSMSSVASTRMFCAGVMEEEGRYLRALEQADSFQLVGDELRIVFANGQGTLIFEREEDDD